MIDITNRFIAFYEYLKQQKIVSGQSDFAQKVGISSSMFTEISKGRSNVGLTVVQNTVLKFTILSLDWLIIGKGDMLRLKTYNTPASNQEIEALNDGVFPYTPEPSQHIVHPNIANSVHPTVHPTGHSPCIALSIHEQISTDKERIIAQQQALIKRLEQIIELTKKG